MQTGEGLRIDSECDVAAIVFGPGDEPDALLERFALDLAAKGTIVSGVVQHGRCTDSGGLTCKLLPTGKIVRLSDALGPGSTSCSLNAGRLTEAGAAVDPSYLAPGTELVIFNRFGKLEEQGRGFRDHIANLALHGVPLITAVAESRFDAWNAFAGGLSVKLRCRRSDIDRWWRAVGSHAGPRGAGPRAGKFCSDWK